MWWNERFRPTYKRSRLVCRGFLGAGGSHETPGSEAEGSVTHSTASSVSSTFAWVPLAPHKSQPSRCQRSPWVCVTPTNPSGRTHRSPSEQEPACVCRGCYLIPSGRSGKPLMLRFPLSPARACRRSGPARAVCLSQTVAPRQTRKLRCPSTVTHSSLAGFRERSGTAVPLEVCGWWLLRFSSSVSVVPPVALLACVPRRGFYWQFLNSLETEDFGPVFIWEARCFIWRAVSLFLFRDHLLSETP